MRYLLRFFLILFLLVLAGSCTKREEPVTEPVPVKDPRVDISDGYTKNAVKLIKEAQYQSANFYLGKAIEIYTQVKSWEKAIQCYIRLGDNYQRLEDYDNARLELNNALELTKNRLGYKHLELAKSFQKVGYKYLSSGKYDLAIEMYDKALSIQLEILDKNHPDVAKTYNSIALAYWNKGDSQKAHQNYNKSFSIKLRQFQKINFDVKKKYKLLDKAATPRGKFSEARNYFNRSLATYRDAYGTNDSLFAAIYENIGILYAFEGNFDQALEYQRKALTLRLNIYGDDSPEMASSYHHVGVCLRLKGDYTMAMNYLDRGLNLTREALGKDHPNIADIHYQMGSIHFRLDEFEKALSSFQKALVTIAPGFSSSNIFKNPAAGKVYMKDRLLKILAAKAEALRMRYLYTPSRREKELRFSLQTYLDCTGLIEEMRRGYKSESYKLFFGEKSHGIYDKAIQTALLLYEMMKEPRHKITAFRLSENSKAAVLAEALAESRARRFSDISDELMEKEKNLRDELNLYDTFLEKEYLDKKNSDPRRVKSLENRFFELKGQYQGLIELFERRYPNYYDLKYNPNPVTAVNLQQALAPNAAFIEYFVGEETLNIFVLTRRDLDVVSMPIDDDFTRVIDACYLAIKKIEAQDFQELNRQLYRWLMEPIRSLIAGKRKLIIIPHGMLFYVPFESLAANAVNVKNFSNLDYMIKHFSFSYHYSARLWYHTFAPGGIMSGGGIGDNVRFIGFAPVFSEAVPESKETANVKANGANARDVVVAGKRFPQLPGTESEVHAIIKLFKDNGKTAKGYFHREASEGIFKSAGMRDYNIIHVATHSLKAENSLKLSGLIFTQVPESPVRQDGILYSGETYNLNLDAELIVLSSCETGIGKLVKGEGMIALNRGFLYSGVRNTIFSLWKVEDKSTSRLMVELYRNILEGKTFAAALRRAKLTLIHNRFTAFPKYWSSFILVGR
ncbi:MAG: CHAT domain-containing protein [bacterium]|nr:CHAT domain-containing protein [bacterium]